MAASSLFSSLRSNVFKVRLAGSVVCVHTGCSMFLADKALLVKLRKTTGYTLINCKKALEKFKNDIIQAEHWLHAEAQREGWCKASKLENRRTSEGLIAVLRNENAAVIVEVNCETDFVARNETFQQLVQDVSFAAMAHQKRAQNKYTKSLMSAAEVCNLAVSEGSSVADHLALAIGRLGENIAVRRAVCVGVPADWRVGSYVHGAVSGRVGVLMGRYGALVVFQGGPEGQEEVLGKKLGQHIVGEAPQSLGDVGDVSQSRGDVGDMSRSRGDVGDVSRSRGDVGDVSRSRGDVGGVSRSRRDVGDVSHGDSETRLLAQNFLLEPQYTVGQYLTLHNARVHDFIRFQCGEETQ